MAKKKKSNKRSSKKTPRSRRIKKPTQAQPYPKNISKLADALWLFCARITRDVEDVTGGKISETILSEEVRLVDGDSKLYEVHEHASNITNTSYPGSVLVRKPKHEAQGATWSPMALNTYGRWSVKDWRLTFSTEALSVLGFSPERIREIKKDAALVMRKVREPAHADYAATWLATGQNISKPDDSGRPIGFAAAYTCFEVCQSFLYLCSGDLPWKLVEGHIDQTMGDSMTGHQEATFYYHAWLELDGIIIEPTARNFVRTIDRDSYTDIATPFGAYDGITPGAPIELVSPVFRPDAYKPIVKYTRSKEYLRHIDSLIPSLGYKEAFPDPKGLQVLYTQRYATYLWRQLGYRGLQEDACGYYYQAYALSEEDEVVEDPGWHFSYIQQQSTMGKSFGKGHDKEWSEGDFLFDYPYKNATYIVEKLRSEMSELLKDKKFIDLLISDTSQLREMYIDIASNRKHLIKYLESNRTKFSRNLTGMFRNSKQSWYGPNALVVGKHGE